MTSGQERAVLELRRLASADDGGFELGNEPTVIESGLLIATVGLRIGPIRHEAGGLSLREREDFVLVIPEGFPFDQPRLRVTHTRFAGFPHVTWGKSICLYQSNLEWNPADGLYGFFDRLGMWLAKAAANDMDPIEGPLEPPHHDTNFSYAPFVIRADAPCAAGESWMGLALLEKRLNRTEVVGWDDLSGDWPIGRTPAFAVILPGTLPMEFPANGADLFRELASAGMDRESMIKNLALAALLAPEGEPLFLVVGLPMRRAKNGSQKIHLAVWAMIPEAASALRKTLPETTDCAKIANIRKKLADSLMTIFEGSGVKWCRVLEDRPEIVVRRDNGTPLAWIAGKNVLLLGCGALGSWAAEILVRSGPRVIHLVDNGIVKPGLLARQNYTLEDIGANKAEALSIRLRAIAYGVDAVPHAEEAHSFIVADVARLREYDVVLDCTASAIFQMKLERDWRIVGGQSPPMVSMIIDGEARHCLTVVLPKNSAGGIWDAYLSTKRRLSIDRIHPQLADAFYSARAKEPMFQPEPGCSDPTFMGSTADVASFAAEALNASLARLELEDKGIGLAWSAPGTDRGERDLSLVELPTFHDTQVGSYRVRIAESVFVQARSWARKNSRERSPGHETGGLLWGVWDDAVRCIWIFDASGPPPDSVHNPGHFLCGVEGTAEEHRKRVRRSNGTCGFVGHWHTHPDMPSGQSGTDIASMATLVSSVSGNQRRSAMLIFGRTAGRPTAGIYIYESRGMTKCSDIVTAGSSQFELLIAVV